MLTLRPMKPADLELVGEWLRQPHVASWYLNGSTIEQEIDDLGQSIRKVQPTEVLIVSQRDRPIGWCQWYRCADYPDYETGVDAAPGDIGIDYAIGEPAAVRGVGTELIAALVAHVWLRHPAAGVIADPEAGNAASRRVLEKNGFTLQAERPVASEPMTGPMAIYRLAAPADAATEVRQRQGSGPSR